MRCIIAGTRDCDWTLDHFSSVVAQCPFVDEIKIVVSGNARGIDRLGEAWAKANGRRCHIMPANWSLYGRSAGPIRNEVMSKEADALIAIRRIGASRGTDDMIRRANEKGLKVFVFEFQN